jgi:DNA sulfur modification protein DndC
MSDFISNFQTHLDAKIAELQDVYRSQNAPHLVGYSGGKDSSTVLQLWYMALKALPEAERTHPLYVITTDTGVENPFVSKWVREGHQIISHQAREDRLPITCHMLEPELQDRFWVKVLGLGYASPRGNMRYCTELLKVKPANAFTKNIIATSGRAIMSLGVRSDESASRARSINRHSRPGDLLYPAKHLAGLQMYAPIKNWTTDDLWYFIMKVKNPWGQSNSELFAMYQDAKDASECQLSLDSSQPSCGGGRMGCYVCTVAKKDRSGDSMAASRTKIDPERDDQQTIKKKQNLAIALKAQASLREAIDHNGTDAFGTARSVIDIANRESFRSSGKFTLYNGKLIHGAYRQKFRLRLFEQVLRAQKTIETHAPADLAPFMNIITDEEVVAICDAWLKKGEIEGHAITIFEDVTGRPFPGGTERYAGTILGVGERQWLEEHFASEREYQMMRNALAIVRDSTSHQGVEENSLFPDLPDDQGQLAPIIQMLSRYQFPDEHAALHHAKATLPDLKQEKPIVGQIDLGL